MLVEMKQIVNIVGTVRVYGLVLRTNFKNMAENTTKFLSQGSNGLEERTGLVLIS